MAFREKIAWLTLTSMVVAYAIYFTSAARIVGDGPTSVVRMLVLFAGVTIAQAVVVAIWASIIAIRSSGEANAPPDERDRAIARRATNVAYYVLMTGAIVTGVVLPFQARGPAIVNATLFAIVIAQAVRNALIVASYRRGWHG